MTESVCAEVFRELNLLGFIFFVKRERGKGEIERFTYKIRHGERERGGEKREREGERENAGSGRKAGGREGGREGVTGVNARGFQ